MEGLRFCGVLAELSEQVRRAPVAAWWLDGDLPGLAHDAVRGAIQSAFDAWSVVAGCSAFEAQSISAADLIIRIAQIDGPRGVLADCELPGPRPQHLRLDGSEAWVIQLARVPSNVIDLERVLRHELGHFWGLDHDQPGAGALMEPTYSLVIDTPTARDAQRMGALYGAPAPVAPRLPATPVPPTPRSRPGGTDTPQPGGVVGTAGDDPPTEMWIVGASGKVTGKFRLERIG